MEKKQIVTAYGTAELEVRQLPRSSIYVQSTTFTFPAGSITPDGTPLRKPFQIPRGAILLPRWDEFGKPDAERLHYIYRHGLYEAMRGIDHALHGYGARNKGGELAELEDILARLDQVTDILMLGKQADNQKIVRAQLALFSIAKKMAGVRSDAKVEALEKIALAQALEIERGGKRMQNFPATIWRLAAAITRLARRRGEIHTIAPHLAYFEAKLSMELCRVWGELEWVRARIQRELKHLEGKGLWSPKIFLERAREAVERLRGIDALPFLNTTNLIRRDLGIAIRAMGKDKEEVKKALRRIIAALRFKDAQRAFETKVIKPFSRKYDLKILTPKDLESTRHRIEDFRKRILILDETGFVQPPKVRVLAQLQTALDALQTAEGEWSQPEQTKKALKRAKSALKNASHLL